MPCFPNLFLYDRFQNFFRHYCFPHGHDPHALFLRSRPMRPGSQWIRSRRGAGEISGLSDFQHNMQAQSALCTAVKTGQNISVPCSKIVLICYEKSHLATFSVKIRLKSFTKYRVSCSHIILNEHLVFQTAPMQNKRQIQSRGCILVITAAN